MSDGQGTGAERRRAQRTQPGPLRVRLHGRWEGVLINISTNGALIQLPIPQPVNARITIDVEFDHDVLQLSGRVVRSNPMPHGGRLTMPLTDTDYYVALEFDQVADIPDIGTTRGG
jgi:hypothetical protein